MMKSITTFPLLMGLFYLPLFGQITFQKWYGTVWWDYGYSGAFTEEGGYIIVGATDVNNPGMSDVYCIKTNAVGDTLWTKTYGGQDDDYGSAIIQTIDGGYVITGTWNYTEAGLIKINTYGDTVWTRIYASPEWDEGYWVTQAIDSGYIITGYRTTNTNQDDVLLIKTDANGNVTWTKTYGGAGDQKGYCVLQTSDNGYIVVGTANPGSQGYWDVYIIKTNAQGDTMWTRTYGGTSVDIGYSITETPDNGYIITGSTWSDVTCDDLILIKIDSFGDVIWTKTYGGAGEEFGYCIANTLDNGYIIAGAIWTYGAGDCDMYLMKINSLGDTLWTRTYGGAFYDDAWFVSSTSDSGYIAVGSTESFGAGRSDVFFIKTDDNGFSQIKENNPGEKSESGKLKLFIFPNPFRERIQFLPQIGDDILDRPSFKVYDVSGTLVRDLSDKVMGAINSVIAWDGVDNTGKQLRSGVYFVRLTVGDLSVSDKIVFIDH